MTTAEIVAAVAQRLDLVPEEEADGTWTLAVRLSEELADESEDSVVLVSVSADTVDWGPAENVEVLVARADAGDLDADGDMATLLGEPAPMWFCRLYVGDDGNLIAEGALPTAGTPVECHCHMVQEVADLAGAASEALEPGD